ncbi:polyphosphate:nucleotide phosphotransferase, PPK2 family [Leptospira fainei serovar Hurstbridge str. BUT 6]|uniref:Polyphosphate:nucleotide phosphotransferase, PPK2 family n=1 Tax=Leptospira fainei serovar Hurstbridge str. BUT 6 TaxID=1193011 RepID=S3VCH6_9LEPT|nr:PPK2 family polyphosphate--nucleotide phosphotransferase [Leptospira fainei]EPG74170.1 polyphosphate:nucleotide phosphotransferase, PPK2 family [Leptospira fainei serovar Hurstbridge str. BUT 6]
MIDLKQISTEPPNDVKKEKAEEDRIDHLNRIGELQTRLFASKEKAILIVLQGMDTSGKDGTVKKLFTVLNPLGCTCVGWKIPNQEEQGHDFLWRIHRSTPAKGMIQVFNRSHYEDVIVPLVKKDINGDRIQKRLEYIAEFERLLSEENNTLVIKFFLHISKQEQSSRIEKRLEDPQKKWKFDPSDLVAHSLYDEHLKAYGQVLSFCEDSYPWKIIPADKKWYRDYLIAKLIREEMDGMDLHYPESESI